MSFASTYKSIVQYYGLHYGNQCGYCKQKDKSSSYSMHGYVLNAGDYQALIDRGWRRSGTHCYKPNNSETCCPSYTMKCDVNKFQLSNSQKKTIKKVNKYLTDGIKHDDKIEFDDQSNFESHLSDNISIVKIKIPETNELLQNFENEASTSLPQPTVFNSLQTQNLQPSKKIVNNSPKITKKGDGPDQSKPLCKKAKLMRLERKAAKHNGRTNDTKKPSAVKMNNKKTLDDFFNETPTNGCHKLNIQLLSVKDTEYAKTIEEEYVVYKKYQTIIHDDPPSNIRDYKRFLIESPLTSSTDDTQTILFGTFHQQYRIDGKLIAVAVLDILPYCVSSVYLFYDPEYHFLSLGRYAALREINYVQTLSRTLPTLEYYYMGFYIHSCPKMKYKANYKPSFLLCPEVYTWHEITEDITNRLDIVKYQRFNTDLTAFDENQFKSKDLRHVRIFDHRRKRCVEYKSNQQLFNEIKLTEYGTMVGSQLSRLLWVCSEEME